MRNNQLYDLFNLPKAGEFEAETAPDLVAPPAQNNEVQRAVGQTATDLYALNFSGEIASIESEADNVESATQQTHTADRTMALQAIAEAEKSEKIEFPESVVKRFGEVMEFISQQDKRVRFSVYDMERLTQHLGKFADEERQLFKQYCKQNPLLDYFGDGMFGFAERVTPDTYWPGVVDVSPETDLRSLVESVVEVMSRSQINRQEFAFKNVLGIVRRHGMELYTDEVDEFIALLAAHPNVHPRENGTYHVPFTHDQVAPKPLAPNHTYRVRQPKDVKHAINQINKTEEFKRAKDLATNKADNRRRGRNRKSKGGRMKSRYQGKKQTFNQLLNQSLSNAPKPVTPSPLQETTDGSTES